MQVGDSEPIVRIRDLQKNSVDFVLENVDLAYVVLIHIAPIRALLFLTESTDLQTLYEGSSLRIFQQLVSNFIYSLAFAPLNGCEYCSH